MIFSNLLWNQILILSYLTANRSVRSQTYSPSNFNMIMDTSPHRELFYYRLLVSRIQLTQLKLISNPFPWFKESYQCIFFKKNTHTHISISQAVIATWPLEEINRFAIISYSSLENDNLSVITSSQMYHWPDVCK